MDDPVSAEEPERPTRPERPWWRSRIALLAGCAAIAVAAGACIVVVSQDGSDQAAPAASTTTAPSTTTTSGPTTTTAPPTAVAPSTNLASPKGEIAAFDAPDGQEIGTVGFWYGYPMTMPILEERPGWLKIMMPERPNGLTAWVPADQVTRSTSPWRMVVDLSETRVTVYKDGNEAWSAALGIGKDNTRTPTGNYFVAVIERPGPAGYGPIVVDLNAHSEDIEDWDGSGDAITAFHGPFGSEELIRSGGGKVSNGCLRMLTEDQLKMGPITLGTPVDIIA